MRVVLISGHVDDELEQEREKAAVAAFLPKPFTSQALTKTIREVLGKAVAKA
jgi:FixJ family two-component response regulator